MLELILLKWYRKKYRSGHNVVQSGSGQFCTSTLRVQVWTLKRTTLTLDINCWEINTLQLRTRQLLCRETTVFHYNNVNMHLAESKTTTTGNIYLHWSWKRLDWVKRWTVTVETQLV